MTAMKVEAIQYGDRKVYAVAAFNRGVAEWLQRLPTVWVEGEVTELRRNARWQSVFFTLKDPNDGACLGVRDQGVDAVVSSPALSPGLATVSKP